MHYVGRRLVMAVLLLLGATFVTYCSLNLLPGDPAVAILGTEATPENVAHLRTELGFDRPTVVRYVDYVKGAIRGDLGRSYRTRQPVRQALGRPLWVSARLMLLAQLLAFALALPMGMLSAYRSGTRLDRGLTTLSFVFLSVPGFVLGLVLMLVLGLHLGWFPTIFPTDAGGLAGQLRAFFLPALTLALAQGSVYARILRSDLISTLQEDFVGAARAKGLSDRKVLFRHALRPSTPAVLTVTGVNIGHLIGGAVVVERLYAVPGLGTLLVQAVTSRDYLMVVGVVTIVCTAFVVLNLLVDLAHGALDPRVRRRLA
jgi:peptide/nickel transport system permease protein